MDKENIKNILSALIKVFLYLAGSVLIGVLISPEFREFVENNPALAALAPIINLIAVLVAKALQEIINRKKE